MSKRNPKFKDKDKDYKKGDLNNDKIEKEGKEKFGRKRNGRKDGSRNGNQDRFFGKEGVEAVSQNDAHWYYATETIGEASANIPYNVFAGEYTPLQLKEGINDVSNRSIPGVLTIRYAGVPGYSANGASPLNVCAKATYSFVRHANSGHSNYEASDLMLYLLAVADIASELEEAKRAYRLAMTYNYVNRHIPDTLLYATGINPDSVRTNLAQFRANINILCAKFSSLAIPAEFYLFARRMLIAQTVLVDSTSMRSQFYLYRKEYKYNYIYDANTGAGALRAIKHADNRTVDEVIEDINSSLNALLSDEDINIMSGDILKAYGSSGLFTIAELNENETQEFKFDENMLSQIENASCDGFNPTDVETLNVYQENNELKCMPRFERTGVLKEKYFNSHKDNPDWKDALEWSRLMTTENGFGSELVTVFEVVSKKYTSASEWSYDVQRFETLVPDTNDTRALITTIDNFDWHPILYVVDDLGNPTTFYGHYGDLKKFTILSEQTIRKMHECALMGEFNALLLRKSVEKY